MSYLVLTIIFEKKSIKQWMKEVFKDYEDMIDRVSLTQKEFFKILVIIYLDSDTQIWSLLKWLMRKIFLELSLTF